MTPAAAAASAGTGAEDPAEPSRTLWADLHERALTVDGDDSAWLGEFSLRLPCGPCRSDWLRMLRDTPPAFGDAYFAWTVDRHNEVNRMLGRSVLSLREALDRWTSGPPARNRGI